MASSTKRSWRLQDFVAHGSNVNCLALGHKSGRVLVTGGDDKKVNLWAVGKPNCIMSLTGHTTAVECVKFGSTEDLVCAGSQAGALKIWDLEAAKIFRTLTGHKSGIRCIDFHPYGDFLTTGSLDNSVKLWDIRRKGCIYTYKAHRPSVNSVKFSPDGQWVASAGEDGTVKLWDLRVGRLLKEFSNHGGPVTAVAFHPNEFLLASSSADRTVHFWDLEKFTLISSTDRDSGSVRSIFFSQGGECLFAGSQDLLKVYGWEPTRTYDTVPVGWGKIQDISAAQNQLIGASFHSTNVVIHIVDLTRVQPFGGTPSPDTPPFAPGQSVRKSFNRQKPLSKDRSTLSVKTIEESDRSGTDPEDESLSLADIQNVGDYQEIFQPSRKMARTPPPEPFPAPLESLEAEDDPSLPQILQPLPSTFQSDTGTSYASQGLSSPEIRDPDFNPLGPNITVRALASPTDPSSLDSTESLQSSTREPTAPIEAWNKRKQINQSPSSQSFPEVDFPIKLSNMHHSPSEPALNQLNSSHSRFHSTSRPNLSNITSASVPKPEPLPLSPSLSDTSVGRPGKRPKAPTTPQPANVEIFMRPAPALIVQKEDTTTPASPDNSIECDFEDFTSPNVARMLGNQNPFPEMSEVEILSTMTRGHDQMMTIMKNRQRNLQITYSLWVNKDLRTAVETAITMNDKAIIVDVLGVLLSRPSIWNLDLCSALLPQIHDLLQSKHEKHITVGADALRLILRNFSSTIKTNVQAPNPTVGVDISREERYSKCKKCYDSLITTRAFLMKRQTMQGPVGHTFRELALLIQNLD